MDAFLVALGWREGKADETKLNSLLKGSRKSKAR
jgi:hypothetical protein